MARDKHNMPVLLYRGFKAGGIHSVIIGCGMQPYTHFWCTKMESKTMRVAQRDLSRIPSTFQAMKFIVAKFQKGKTGKDHTPYPN